MSITKALIRRKKVDYKAIDKTDLNRCLNVYDLTCLGIGSTLGLGAYVLVGDVASRESGPAACVSFFIAAVASVFAGLCYAEFGARVPRAGSAYVYSYVTVGEFMAFIIGWNLILEYVIGAASVARGYSGYIDSLVNGTIQRHFEKIMPIHVSELSSYPDFLSFGIILFLTAINAFGVKESIRLHTILTIVNLSVICFTVVCGAININFHNWNLSPDEIPDPDNNGRGGFMPFGFSGVMAGAATCFFAFIGFDVIAATGEEAKNPQRTIPLSIVLSLIIVCTAYVSLSAVQTLILPYYTQSEQNTKGAPLPYIFEQIGWIWAKYFVTVGALTGLATSLLGCLYPLPRVLYSMASDGIVFKFLAYINPTTKTPIIACIVGGLLSAIMSSLFDITQLADMMSIGTLLAYTLVAESILIIRYHSADDKTTKKTNTSDYEYEYYSNLSMKYITYQLFNINRQSKPTHLTQKIAYTIIVAINIDLIILESLLVFCEHDISHAILAPVISISVLIFVLIILIIALLTQPKEMRKDISFLLPGVPFVPILSVFVNFYLMLKLSRMTWIRFAVWMVIGFLIYGFYGIWHSNERKDKKQSKVSTKIVHQTRL